MSGPACKQAYRGGSITFEGKWIIVVILLALLHVISFTWMIHLQMKVFGMEKVIRLYEEDLDGYEENEAGSYSSSYDDNDIERIKRSPGKKAGCETLIEKCCKSKLKNIKRKARKKTKHESRMPKAARQISDAQKHTQHALQLRGTKKGDSVSASELTSSWFLDFPEISKDDDKLQFEKATGSINIKVSGFYFIYAQMQPLTVKEGTRYWKFSIELDSTSDGGTSKVISGTNLCHVDTKCSELSPKTTMVATVARYLQKGDSLRIKVNDGTKWWSSVTRQKFGVFSIGE